MWDRLVGLVLGARRVHLQWVPSQCDLEGNGRVDSLAKEASQLPQDEATLDVVGRRAAH